MRTMARRNIVQYKERPTADMGRDRSYRDLEGKASLNTLQVPSSPACKKRTLTRSCKNRKHFMHQEIDRSLSVQKCQETEGMSCSSRSVAGFCLIGGPQICFKSIEVTFCYKAADDPTAQKIAKRCAPEDIAQVVRTGGHPLAGCKDRQDQKNPSTAGVKPTKCDRKCDTSRGVRRGSALMRTID